MKRIASLLALALCFPLVAHADDASRRAKAGELLMLLHVDRTITQIMDNLMQQSSAIATRKSGGKLTPEAQAALSDFQKKLTELLDPQIGWKVIEPEYVKFYADGFTEDQLDSILGFYKSPSGKALLDKVPAINMQATQLLQSKITALQPEVKQLFTEFDKSLTPSAPPTLNSLPPAKSTP